MKHTITLDFYDHDPEEVERIYKALELLFENSPVCLGLTSEPIRTNSLEPVAEPESR